MPGPSDAEGRFAQALFRHLPRRYDLLAEILSFGQNARWRKCLVDQLLAAQPQAVLDVATGTAGVALQLVERSDGTPCVTGLDISEPMLRLGQAKILDLGRSEQIRLVQGRGEELPFADATFDALSFTYLLRYVREPRSTLEELARVVRPGGLVVSLEFGVPPHPFWRACWWLYTRLALPVGGILGGHTWIRVGRFLGPSIDDHYRRYPLPSLIEAWHGSGLTDVHVRRLSLGGGLVMWARKAT